MKHPAKKQSWRRKGEISVACYLMRAGVLDVCLDCGQVYSTRRGGRRRLKLKKHYKGYLWFNTAIEDKRRRPRGKAGRRRREMSIWVHRLAWMKKRAMRDFRVARRRGEAGELADWKSFVFDVPSSLHIDHKDLNIENNRGRNLRLRTGPGNSGKGPLTAVEAAEAEAEYLASTEGF